MKNLSGFVAGLSRMLDRIAAICIVFIMVLVVGNILLRVFIGSPILGTYEYVGFLTAAMIGLALASCALQNGHIAVSFVLEKFPTKMQAVVDIIMNIFALSFWGLSAWYIGKYANSMTVSGVVSPTTQTPFYPFVYLVSFGMMALCLVLLLRLVESIKKVALHR